MKSLMFLSGLALSLHAAPGDLDLSFSPVISGYGPVGTVVVEPDGSLFIGGTFTGISGQGHSNLARLSTNGQPVALFDPGPNGVVSVIAAAPDGKKLIAGGFDKVSGITRNRLARINLNGTLDEGFNVADSGCCASSMLVQPDGKILVVGSFTNFGGRRGVVRLNTDGNIDGSFNPQPNGSVECAIWTGGKMIIGGSFTALGEVPRSRIARLHADGSVDMSFNPPPDINDGIWTMSVQSDGKIIVGAYNGGQTRLARLHGDGTLDAGFNAFADRVVQSIALQADGKIIVGGTFWHLVRFNPDGTPDSEFDRSRFAEEITCVALQPAGEIIVAGYFNNGIARLRNGPGTESLTATGADRLLWLRAGTIPEVTQVAFESAANGGANWTLLGDGVRIAGGWELTGLHLIGTEVIRARARTASTSRYVTQGFVESVVSLTPFPEIAVEHPPGTALQSAATIDFGPIVAGTAGTKRITIRSAGTSDLTGVAVTKAASGTPGDFNVSAPGAIVPRDFATAFDVTFSPSALGERTATLFLASNDPDENPFSINVTGSMATPSEAWRQAHFGSPYGTGPGADLSDPDGDGIVNIVEIRHRERSARRIATRWRTGQKREHAGVHLQQAEGCTWGNDLPEGVQRNPGWFMEQPGRRGRNHPQR